MRAIKIVILVLVSVAGMGLFEQKAEAGSSFYLGFTTYHPYYYGFYRPYYYRPYYYRPYWYPYSGYGYGYGYGYPYRYYYGYGEVRTEIKPDEAKVYLDGDYVGVADDFNSWYQRLNIEPGRHRLVFRLEGFRPYAVTLRVLPGRDYHIKHVLQPGEDVIPESEMRLPREERDYRYSPRYRDRDYDRKRDYNRDDDRDREYDNDRDYDDRDRDYDEEYDDDRFGGSNGNSSRDDQYNRPEDFSKAEPRELNTEKSEKSLITIQVEPRDATIYIDGTYYGTADAQNSNQIQVLLARGNHQLEVVRPGFETFKKDFEVNGNAARNITIQLEKK